jgi:competence protein ComEC
VTSALACLLAWSAGVALATVAMPGTPAAGAAALVGAAVVGSAGAAVRPAVVCLAAAACLLGVARAEVPTGDPGADGRAPALAGLQAVVGGRVVDDPRLLAGGVEVLVEPASLATAAGVRRPAGRVLAFVRGAVEVAIDDRVQVSGRLDLPRDRPDFDRRASLARSGAFLEIRSARLDVIRRAGGVRALPAWLRDHYRRAVARLVPSPHSEVLVGIVLGIRTGIPPRLQQDLVATGLVHLLVLSGLKVAVFARLVVGALRPLLRRAATLPAVVLIALYALAGGATPAAVRAAGMGALALVAAHLGRPTHLWTSLAATAAAMLAWRPELAWDVGFQLSFAGTAAIVLLTPGIDGWLTRPAALRRVPGWLREPFAVTCAAQVGTVPLMATDFHLLSPVAPLANAAVLPLLPAMVMAGLLLAPLAAVPQVGRLVALPLTGTLAYVEQVAALLARPPGAAVPVPAFPPWSGAAYYAALGGAVAAARTRGAGRAVAIAVGIVVPLVVGGVELAAWGHPAPGAAVMAVGRGQAVLLTGRDGAVLVDGGPSPARLAGELGARLPPWSRRLAALVITGPGLGHVGGLAGLGYPADLVVVPEDGPAGTAWRAAALAQAARGARVVPAHAGQRLTVAGLGIEVLSPPPRPAEPDQLALRVTGPGGASFCDLADLDPDGQAAAAAWLRGRCDTLLLPGGGRSRPAPELLAAARPDRLVVSDDGGTLARDLPRGSLSRTSEEGTIVVPL